MNIFKGKEHELRYAITHWFQPICHVKDNSIIGYEALLRDESTQQASPVDIFREAEKRGQINRLDRTSIKIAVDSYKDQTNPLFLNIFPSTMLDKDFMFWWDINVPPFVNIVLELLENEPISDWKRLKQVTKELQARGVKIAIDDMGGGYSFFQQWIELEPDFIKLDRYFAENLSINPRKQKTLRSLVDLLSDTAELIIEGIEKEEDLSTAENLGICYAQGYLLGKPSPRERLFKTGNM
jgi:EAL domain-containing protein (putative c-di-GMP-specific phosphodiesterase class I)